MNVAIIVEGIPDAVVCTYFAERIQPENSFRAFPLGKKPLLIEKCGQTAKNLLKDGYDRVIIVWDLHPDSRRRTTRSRRRKKGTRHSCKSDVELIMNSLSAARTNVSKVDLVCIDPMLETWLMADLRAIEAYLSTKEHPLIVKSIPGLRRSRDHKSVLITFCRQNGRGGRAHYNDIADAIKIAELIPEEPHDDLRRLTRKSESFRSFARAVANAV